MLELLIRNGEVIDGTGAPGFRADIGIKDNTLSLLVNSADGVDAQRVIDAKDMVVCPGFIDMHAHSGLVIVDDPQHEPKLRQGVTTEVIGVDGNSYAPFRHPKDLEGFIEFNSGLDGRIRSTTRWSSVAEYLDVFNRKVAVNVIYLIGNSPLRINAVGWEQRPATTPQLEDMKSMLREGLEEGAFGVSTGLDYPPGSYASTDELVELAGIVARRGGIYHTHVRYSLGDRFLDPFREAIEIGRRSGVAVHITHFYQRLPVTGAAEQMLELVERARDAGLDITFDSYPYTLSQSRLLIVVPQWAHDGGPMQLKQVLNSAEMRPRLREEIRYRGPSWQDMYLTNFTRPDNHRLEGRSVAEIAAILGKSEADAICDLLLDEDLGISYVANNGNGATLPKFVSHPLSMVGSDGVLIGDFPSPRTYGTFPVILSEFVRMEGFLSLPDAIAKMTGFAARRLGLSDRGVIKDGMRADVVVFDPRAVGTLATRRSPKQFPNAIPYVIVNGELSVDGGAPTGKLAGQALRP